MCHHHTHAPRACSGYNGGMPLTLPEVVTLSESTIALGAKIGAAFSAQSPGGKRVTKAEAAELVADAKALIEQLATDIGD